MTNARWALVTGASSGIGRATAVCLARAGFNMFLIARRAERLDELREQIVQQQGVEVIVCPLNVSDAKQVDAFVEAHAQSLENIDVLINNAGLAKGSEKIPEAKISDWDVMIDTNVKGLLYITRAVIPFMLKKRRGHVVNLGSVAGRWVYPGGAVYCATKFAVRALSEGLRLDLFGTPLRVTNIEPGMVETEFSEVRLASKERAEAVYKGMKPLAAEDIAETILWCVDRPAHVNIQELVIFPTDQAAIQLVQRR